VYVEIPVDVSMIVLVSVCCRYSEQKEEAVYVDVAEAGLVDY
jgi:hypothetical protein